jgi:hypothetical protein
VRELEATLNERLVGCTVLGAFQLRLYAIIDELNSLDHFLGRWEYDCEIEYWGGGSYLDRSVPDELVLRSEFPHGVRLRWGEFSFDDSEGTLERTMSDTPSYPYATHLNVLYPSLEVVDVPALVAACTDPWYN